MTDYKLVYTGGSLPKTHILYRNHSIYKKIYPPSIIFYILINSKHELHILRVLQEQHDWHNTLGNTHHYTYPD